MGTARGSAGAAVKLQPDPILEELFEAPWKFEFFQAVRILERAFVTRQLSETSDENRPRLAPIASDATPQAEACRFRVPASLGFPTSEIANVTRPLPPVDAAEGVRPPWNQVEMSVNFFGLTGPNGVLPYHYTTQLIALAREKDKASGEFFDLFNHRLISLFYSAWEKYRFPMVLERAKLIGTAREDDFTSAIHALAGFGTGGLRGRMAFADDTTAYFAGHLGRQPRSVTSIEQMLEEYFNFPAKISQFMGQWLVTADADHSCLGGPRSPARNVTLGLNLVLGEMVWDVSGRFSVRVGPLTYNQYKRLLPDGEDYLPIIHMVRTCVGAEMDFDIQPTLMGMEVPALQLQGATEPLPRLGWNTWLLSSGHIGDFDAVIFESGPNQEAESILETNQWVA